MSPIANMLVQLKNAQNARHEHVVIPFSKLTFGIISLLKDKGFVAGADKKKRKGDKKDVEFNVIDVTLKYEETKGAITDIKLISKPSRRMYAGKNDLKKVRDGFGIAIVSTSKGLMTGDEAHKSGLGGEVICEIW